MVIFLFLLLLAIIAVLSRPGIVRQNLFTNAPLDNIQNLIWQRALALVLMVPMVIIEVASMPAWINFTGKAVWVIAILVVGVPLLAFPLAQYDKSGPFTEQYAGLSAVKGRWGAYLIITVLYMIAYEILLRGTLLHYLVARFDLAIAIIINAAVYSIMHILKNKREALLSFPLGVLLCGLTVYTKSVWPAVVFHTAMALSFEFYYSRKSSYVR